MGNSNAHSMTYAPDLLTPSDVQNTGGISTSSRSGDFAKQEVALLSQRLSNLEATVIQDRQSTVVFCAELGLAVDFKQRTIRVDESIGVHWRLTRLQDAIDKLHQDFSELYDKLLPLLMHLDERNAVFNEMYKDIDALKAQKDKLAVEVSELNLLL